MISKATPITISIPPIWPKLWRRLEDFLRDQTGLGGFIDFVAGTGERVDDLTTFEQRRIYHYFEVSGNRVRMTIEPENLRVVSRA